MAIAPDAFRPMLPLPSGARVTVGKAGSLAGKVSHKNTAISPYCAKPWLAIFANLSGFISAPIAARCLRAPTKATTGSRLPNTCRQSYRWKRSMHDRSISQNALSTGLIERSDSGRRRPQSRGSPQSFQSQVGRNENRLQNAPTIIQLLVSQGAVCAVGRPHLICTGIDERVIHSPIWRSRRSPKAARSAIHESSQGADI